MPFVVCLCFLSTKHCLLGLCAFRAQKTTHAQSPPRPRCLLHHFVSFRNTNTQHLCRLIYIYIYMTNRMLLSFQTPQARPNTLVIIDPRPFFSPPPLFLQKRKYTPTTLPLVTYLNSGVCKALPSHCKKAACSPPLSLSPPENHDALLRLLFIPWSLGAS